MENVLDLKKKKPENQEPAEEPMSEQELAEELDFPNAEIGSRSEAGNRAQNPKNSAIPVMLSWSGPMYARFPNSRFLYASIALLCGVGVFFIFFERNLFAVSFFFLSAVMLFVTSRQEPPTVDFSVGPLSVKAGPKEYKFSEIKSFWVEYNPGGLKELSLQLDKWYRPYLKIPLMDQDPTKVRIILLKFVPEIEHKESMLDSLSHLLGV